MRRIGTISSALGFIFLGIWMIISRNNADLGAQIFKWWPAIIIILGLEILVGFSLNNNDERKPRFNGLIIFVILIFIVVNAFQSVVYSITGRGFSFDNVIRWGESFDMNNYKEIKTSKVLDANVKKFVFETDNGLVKLKKSTDGKIKIDASVFVSKNAPRNSYDIKESKGVDGYTVSMKEEFIKKVYVDIYVPNGVDINIDADNSSINGEDNFTESNMDIKTDSGNVELNGAASLALNIDSGIMKVNNVPDVRIKGNSGTVSVNGDTRNLDLELDSGTFNLDNNTCKNVNVVLNSGMINIKTKDKNVNVSADLNSGLCTVNGERRINSGVNKSFGTGEDKVRIKLDSGTIKFSSQE